MNCIIVDDEPLAVDLIIAYIDRIEDLNIIATSNNSLDVITLLKEHKVDLVFLDIEMPEITGLELVQHLPSFPQFIFTTAYPQYALDGFELNATDYLVKPIPFPRFLKAVARARELHEMQQKQPEQTEIENDFIFVKSEYENIKVKTADIIFIEGLKDYIKIRSKDCQKSILTLMSFKTILEKLPSRNFLRIHRSYIVNIEHVTSVQKSKLIAGGEQLPIGETYKNNVLKRLGLQ
ncbi:LytR/AlgR family response regulator transcription factor [Pseudotenacibaculum haliotis]|uniref:LytR/AlgR family response regulator transcription factor n=1 Tax=Pseudotenacibaculum haliotis TaxID=1862138 RepID=A0ABW5LS05_9FLAO